MVDLFAKGRLTGAREIHLRLLPLFHVLFIESSPGPVKAALEMLGAGTGELRLPLVPVTEATREKVKRVLKDLDLL
jgi:4-hydroxy-tetrahydrodipicolinate synthase